MKRVRFGPFEANLDGGELRRDGVVVPIQDLPFRLLATLLERPGELVTRTELTTRLWGSETFVDATAGLNTAVAKLREALGDNSEQPSFIETVPKRGYRFIGRISDDFASAPPARPGAPGVSVRSIVVVTAIVTAIAGLLLAYQLRKPAVADVRVAVVLFDNETGNPQMDALAQGLTDATVTALTTEPHLAVIGNAAVLRTTRPFRDIEKVRDELNAQYIVIGQVQLLDGGIVVRAHLIRGRDQAHVWVNMMRRTDAGDAALQSDVAGQVRAAVAAQVSATPTS